MKLIFIFTLSNNNKFLLQVSFIIKPSLTTIYTALMTYVLLLLLLICNAVQNIVLFL